MISTDVARRGARIRNGFSARAKDRALDSHHPSRLGIAEEHAEEIGVGIAELRSPRHAAVRGPEDGAKPPDYDPVVRVDEKAATEIGIRATWLVGPGRAAIVGTDDGTG